MFTDPPLTVRAKVDGSTVQLLVTAKYGYETSVLIPPAAEIYSKAWDGRPPLHPWLSKA